MKWYLFIFIQLVFVSGCIMFKIGDAKYSDTQPISTGTKITYLESFNSLEPLLSKQGRLELCIKGSFYQRFSQTQREVKYGDEWMAVGLFPGYDSLRNGYGHKDGKGNDGVAFFTLLFGNSFLAGIPTVCSLLEFLTPKATKRHKSCIAEWGVVGTYKYEGDRYEMSSREESVEKTDALAISVLKLRGYDIVVDGMPMSDSDGVIETGKIFKKGESVRFRITSLPKFPKIEDKVLSPIINVEFVAVCN